MRIALVSTPFVPVPPPAYGGTELVVHALARALVRAGHAVTLFATGDSEGEDVRALFPAAAWPPDPYAELLHARFAAREIARGGFDVVHAHLPAVLAFVEEMGVPVVYTRHHVEDHALARFYAHVPSVTHVAISRRQAALAARPPACVVHHGLEPDLYVGPVAGPGGDRVVFLGRLSHCKGPEVAIAAARRAGLPITVCGRAHASDEAPEGWADDVLRPALAAPHVTWMPAVGLPEKRRLFARSRALVAPHRWEEPFGLVLAEALLAGCPVVTSPRGAAPELVRDGVDGFLVEGVSAVAAALHRAGRLDRAAIRASARARFSADRMAAGYLAVYRAAIAAASGRGRAAAEDGAWTAVVP